MIGWIVVDQASLEDEATLSAWVDEGVAYAESLPAK
jgi:hypothetical protein